MDFRLTEEQEEFKQQVAKFIADNVTPELIEEVRTTLVVGPGPRQWELARKLGDKGWLAPHFPKQYGGLGLSPIYRAIVVDEQMKHLRGRGLVGAAGVGLGVAIDMAGPVILQYAGEEIKEEFLPRIARGEIEFCLGLTEPEAGSDLSRIEMRAVEDGDYFVITGVKRFNSQAHYAQYHWLAARTDPSAVPGYRGLSMFIVDLGLPGITLASLSAMSGTRTNEVFYDEVRVHKRYLVGEKNRGWHYLMHSLDHERVFTLVALQQQFESLLTYVKETSHNGILLSKDRLVRQKLAQVGIELSIARRFNQRVLWLQDQGMPLGTEAAVLKVFASEFMQRMMNSATHILGLYGLLRRDSKYARLEGEFARDFLESIILTVGAGSSEIMRNIIALRGLGLPRGGQS
jgi:hypothetical protein